MDKECFVRLNDILREVDARRTHKIADLRDIPDWFEGDGDEEEMKERVDEINELIEDADMTGMIHLWPVEGSRQGPSQFWDWTTKAHREAQQLGITLINPQGDNPLFAAPTDRITLPTITIQNIDIGLLVRDVYGHLNRVYEEQDRYIIFHQGEPIAAVVPLLDIEMIKDLQIMGNVGNWVEWNRNIRDRLKWPLATKIDVEDNP